MSRRNCRRGKPRAFLKANPRDPVGLHWQKHLDKTKEPPARLNGTEALSVPEVKQVPLTSEDPEVQAKILEWFCETVQTSKEELDRLSRLPDL